MHKQSTPIPARIRHLIIPFLCLLVILLPASLHADELHHYVFNVGTFTELKVQDNVNVVCRNVPDSIGKAAYTGVADFGDAFIFSNSGKSLKIQVTTDDVGKPGLPTIYVYTDHLEKVENYSDFRVDIEHPAQCSNFLASVIGNGVINVAGLKANTITAKATAGHGTITLIGEAYSGLYRVTGAGTINGQFLSLTKLECKILGGGEIRCDAKSKLTVKGLGSTKIYYLGTPLIKHSGGGKLIPLK